MVFQCFLKSQTLPQLLVAVNIGPEAAKNSSRAAQERPRPAQERPRAVQERSKSVKNGPRPAKSGPKTAQIEPRPGQERIWRPRAAQERAKTGPRADLGAIQDRLLPAVWQRYFAQCGRWPGAPEGTAKHPKALRSIEGRQALSANLSLDMCSISV